jgi:hypothetical protein
VEETSKDNAVTTEMARIQSAYIQFYNDNFPSSDELKTLATYGLYPLVSSSAPSDVDEDDWPIEAEYDPYNNLGWDGPYIQAEGTAFVDVSDARQEEKEEGDGGIKIPIIEDPYGGYYRVMVSDDDDENISLICTGINQQLDAEGSGTDDYGWITNQVDDVALPLTTFK